MIRKKPTAILFFLTLLPLVLFGQTDKDIKLKDVPQAVKDYMKKAYPEVNKIEYYTETENKITYYEASFHYNGDEYKLLLLSDGTLHETEIERKLESLPLTVKDNINKDLSNRYSRFKVEQVQEVNPDKQLRYEIALHGKKGKHSGFFELFYDKDGNFISEEEKTIRSILNNSGF